MKTFRHRIMGSAVLGGITGALLFPAPVHAQDPAAGSQARDYDLSAQDLGAALSQLAHASGLQLAANGDLIAGKKSKPVHGHLSPQQALDSALAGSGLIAVISGDTVIIGGRGKMAAEAASVNPPSGIVVTGSRIRGAHVASPVISLSRQMMLDEGQTDLGQVVRDIPQSFSGGQNPGVVANTPGLQNQNFNASSTINLRGLGPDATLTLINGHRIAYDGASQALDISSIPVAAIERLEIVADGSSAIYGSDAVGGVANIILRRDYDGLETDARLGKATDGGDFQQQYDVVGGKRWSTGGFIATYDFQRSTAISAGDRSYTRQLDGSSTLLPYGRQHSGVVSAHQDLGTDFSFSVDGTVSHRFNRLGYPTTVDAPYDVLGVAKSQATTGFSIAPKLDWHAPRDWLVSLSGVYGHDRANFGSYYYSDGQQYEQIVGHYTDQSKVAEFDAEGPLFRLPGGAARLAIGAGYRDISLRGYGTIHTATLSRTAIDYDYSRPSRYGYAELYLPFVSPEQAVPGVHRLAATGAVRYEDYGRVGHEATPKVGLTYAPVDGVELRGTWGRSFKAPTLYQQHSGYTAALYDAARTGASGSPAGSTVLDLTGGNPDLKSERSSNWTAGFVLTPPHVPGLSLDVSFFGIRYQDRINDVAVPLNNVLNNPAYQTLIMRDPDAATVQALADGAMSLSNVSGTAFDPAKVIAIVDDRYLNVTSQHLHGIDFATSYVLRLSASNSLRLSGSATYLSSHQQLLPTVSPVPLAGTIYNPPHWRARVGGTLHGSRSALSLFINYIGGVTDNVTLPREQVGSMTTLDAAARYTPSGHGWFSGMTFALSTLNLLNAKPSLVRESDPTQAPYDSTNYSAIGRVISVSLTKAW